jgi:hypothetical protein
MCIVSVMTQVEIRPSNEPLHPKLRSCVSNGSKLFTVEGLDGRSAPSRRFRDLVADVASDLGGFDRLSALEKQLIRRAASLSIMCEAIEADLVGEKQVDVERYGMLTDRLRRLAQRLGLSRLARDVEKGDRSLAELFRGAENRRGVEIDG